MAAVLVLVVAVVTLVTVGVGILGFTRIRKDRTTLKQYEQAANMGRGDARTPLLLASKTETETAAKSHMRADTGAVVDMATPSLLRQLLAALFQLTGIPLLLGATAAHAASTTSTPTEAEEEEESMGNTATPTHALLTRIDGNSNSAEVDTHHASKEAPTLASEPQWSDSASSEDEAISSDEDTQTDEEKFEELRSHLLVDGIQFYSTVAAVSASIVSHTLDIALFRASTIVLHERRKAEEDASLQGGAVESRDPDVMCLPPHANVRYVRPLEVAKSAAAMAESSPRAAMSPKAAKIDTGFLSAA